MTSHSDVQYVHTRTHKQPDYLTRFGLQLAKQLRAAKYKRLKHTFMLNLFNGPHFVPEYTLAHTPKRVNSASSDLIDSSS